VFEFEKKIKFKKVHIQNCLNMGNVLNFKNFRFEYFFETLARGGLGSAWKKTNSTRSAFITPFLLRT
jgi:hypothetical protein